MILYYVTMVAGAAALTHLIFRLVDRLEGRR